MITSKENAAIAQDLVRVLRVIEYTGPRNRVEETVRKSLQGTKDVGNGLITQGCNDWDIS